MSTATQEKQQTQVKEVFALWKKESKDGKPYFSGKSRTNVELVAFYNGNKKNPNEPDLRIYAKDENGRAEEKELASMWCKVSEKTGNKYLSGKLNDQEIYLRGFFNNEKDSKRPYIKVYLQTELDAANDVKKQAESKQVEEKKESKKESKPKKQTPLF